MLNGIPGVLSPDLLKILCEMGHGDRILLADGNFPCESVGKNARVIRCDGHGVTELLDAVLRLMPLDDAVQKPVLLMQTAPDIPAEPLIWERFYRIIASYDARGKSTAAKLERFAFYEESRSCYAIVATGERALYGNIMLQKGVVN